MPCTETTSGGRSRSGEPEDWVQALSSPGADADRAVRTLHEILLRVARADAHRRASGLGLAGPELDDIVHQAADDALVSITDKLPMFRGESKFTTWAYKFVVFEVGTKINRHRWHRETVAYDDVQWNRLPDLIGSPPEQESQRRDHVAGIRRAVDKLTPKQRHAFVAIVVDGVPLDVVTAQAGSNRNAIYKLMFDARLSIKASLVADDLMDAAHSVPRRSR